MSSSLTMKRQTNGTSSSKKLEVKNKIWIKNIQLKRINENPITIEQSNASELVRTRSQLTKKFNKKSNSKIKQNKN